VADNMCTIDKNKGKLNRWIYYFIVYSLVTYPLFYFSYKYNMPKFGSDDIYHYLRMYQDPFNFSVADGPFVYRQLSTIIVNYFEKFGIYYDAQISFNDPNFSQRFYFAAILTNWLSLILGSCLVSIHFEKENTASKNNLAIILVCFIFFNGYSGIFHGLSETTDGVSVALAISCYVAYKNQYKLIFAFLMVISIFQRELLMPIFGAVIFADILQAMYYHKKISRNYIWMFLSTIMTSFVYLYIRLYLLPDSSGVHDNQTSISQSIYTFFNTDINYEFIRQVFFTQNVLILALFFLILLPKFDRMNDKYLRKDLISVSVVFVCIFLFGLAAGIGNNIGRILMYGTPFYMSLLLRCFQLFNK